MRRKWIGLLTCFWPQRVLNDLQRSRLSCGRIIRLLSHPTSPLPPHFPSPVSKLPLFPGLPVCRRLSLLMGGGKGVGEEPNHTTAREPSPQLIILYSLYWPIQRIYTILLHKWRILQELHPCQPTMQELSLFTVYEEPILSNDRSENQGAETYFVD